MNPPSERRRKRNSPFPVPRSRKLVSVGFRGGERERRYLSVKVEALESENQVWPMWVGVEAL